MGAYAAPTMLGLSVLSSIRAGQATEVSYKAKAEQATREAKLRELSRNRRLLESLSSQNAQRAATGIAALEGSSKNMMREDIRISNLDTLIDRGNTSRDRSVLLSEGRTARNTGVLRAGMSILDYADREHRRG